MGRLASRGATLIDTIVSTALMLVVFVGIAAAFQLSVEVVTNNKSRAGAIALANERMEYIRSLPYGQVGVVGGIPSGLIAQSEDIQLNGVPYIRRTIVLFGDDPKDGLGGADENDIITDYKDVKVEVSWASRHGTRRISLTTRVSPAGIEAAVAGGVLALAFQDASAVPVVNALVTIINTTLNPNVNITLFSDNLGEVNVIGAPPGAGYRIVATRSGFTTAQTYDATVENTNPTPGHLTVADGQTTSATFSIDAVATKNIRSFTPVEDDTWSDSFANETKIGASASTEVSGGTVKLSGGAGSYETSGTIRSVAITPANLASWESLEWDDTRPAQTNILYRVYNGDGTELVPDGMIPGNSTGFAVSPVDLTNVAVANYPSLSVHATLGTADVNETPEIQSWDVGYQYGPVPLPNLVFGMQGTKTYGSGPGGFLYKYSTTTLSTGVTAGVNVPNLEWDTYTITVNSATGYDIASVCNPQPEGLLPGGYLTTDITVVPHTTHSLLVDVRSSGGVVIPNANVRLFRGAFDVTQAANACGQTFYSALSQGSPGDGNAYSIEVSATGFQPFSANDVSVQGTSRLSVVLN